MSAGRENDEDDAEEDDDDDDDDDNYTPSYIPKTKPKLTRRGNSLCSRSSIHIIRHDG